MKRVIKASAADAYQDLLYYIADRFSVNSPEYRGARQPEYSPGQVNPTEYGDNLRPKYYECNVEGQRLELLYITQEEFNTAEAQELVREIERCIDYLYDKFCEDVGEELMYPSVDITIECRDGEEYGHYIVSLG